MLPDHAVVEIGHREDEVEIVPLEHTVGDGELLEAARLKVATDAGMRGGTQERPEIHFGRLAVGEFNAQTVGTDVLNALDMDSFFSDGNRGNPGTTSDRATASRSFRSARLGLR